MGFDDGVQRKGTIDDRFQRAGLEAVVDILFAAGKLLVIPGDLDRLSG